MLLMVCGLAGNEAQEVTGQELPELGGGPGLLRDTVESRCLEPAPKTTPQLKKCCVVFLGKHNQCLRFFSFLQSIGFF